MLAQSEPEAQRLSDRVAALFANTPSDTSKRSQINDDLLARTYVQLVPQLISRLPHSSPVVRATLVRLLVAVALRWPERVLYPICAVLSSCSVQSHQRYQQCQAVVSSFMNHSPRCSDQMRQVAVFVRELNRLGNLWEDRWLALLRSLQIDVPFRVKVLTEEAIAESSESTAVSPRVQYALAMAAVWEQIDILCKETIGMYDQMNSAPEHYDASKILAVLGAVTTPPAERSISPAARSEPLQTPYEDKFVRRYGPALIWIVQCLRHPLDARNPQQTWEAVNTVITQLRTLMSSHTDVTLQDVSPVLMAGTWCVSREASLLAVDGMHASGGTYTMQESSSPSVPHHSSIVSEVGSHVEVLRTKTRPKKLLLIDGTGRRVPFLVKSREDLRLDERIMQLCQVSNQLIASDIQALTQTESTMEDVSLSSSYVSLNRALRRGARLEASTYAVVPLGDRCGLIRWVEEAVPVFDIHKAWMDKLYHHKWLAEQAQAHSALPKSSPSSAAASQTAVVKPKRKPLSPSEAFHLALREEFKRQKLDRTLPRKEWPLPSLANVFRILLSTTEPEAAVAAMRASNVSSSRPTSAVTAAPVAVTASPADAQVSPATDVVPTAAASSSSGGLDPAHGVYRDVLARELWFSSADPADQQRKTTQFATSAAVMSVLGTCCAFVVELKSKSVLYEELTVFIAYRWRMMQAIWSASETVISATFWWTCDEAPYCTSTITYALTRVLICQYRKWSRFA